MNQNTKYTVLHAGEPIAEFESVDTAVACAIGHGSAIVTVTDAQSGLEDGTCIFTAENDPDVDVESRSISAAAKPVKLGPEIGDRYIMRATASAYRVADIAGGGATPSPKLYFLRLITPIPRHGDQTLVVVTEPLFRGMFWTSLKF